MLTYVSLGEITQSERDPKTGVLAFEVSKGAGSELSMSGHRMDPEWLAHESKRWFSTGANLREQHDESRAVGRATSLEIRDDGVYFPGIIVDPVTAAKVENKVLCNLSVGVNGAVIDKKREPGVDWVVGGTIVEYSLVDRPANPTTKLVLAQAAGTSFKLVENVVDLTQASNIDHNHLHHHDEDGGERHKHEHTHAAGVQDHNTVGSGVAHEHQHSEAEDDSLTADQGDNDDDVDEAARAVLIQRDVSTTERKSLAKKGDALPGGGFPIASLGDLKNAIRAIGRAKDPAKTKAFIKKRAAALGQSKLIPATWSAAMTAQFGLAIAALEQADPGAEPPDGANGTDHPHDPAEVASIRAALINCLVQELAELANGDPELCDINSLVECLTLFLNWWSGEAFEGELPSPYAPEGTGDMKVSMAVVAELIQSASAEDAGDEDKKALATVLEAFQPRITAVTESAVAEATEGLRTELEQVKKLALPDGPAKHRNLEQLARAGKADLLDADAQAYLKQAAEATDRDLAEGSYQKAKALQAEAEKLRASRQ
jgi:hypothetical protein